MFPQDRSNLVWVLQVFGIAALLAAGLNFVWPSGEEAKACGGVLIFAAFVVVVVGLGSLGGAADKANTNRGGVTVWSGLSVGAIGSLQCIGFAGLGYMPFVLFAVSCFAAACLFSALERIAIAAEAARASLSAIEKPQLSASLPDAAAEPSYHLQLGCEVRGPFTLPALAQLVAAGVAATDTPALRVGAAEWQTVADLLPSL